MNDNCSICRDPVPSDDEFALYFINKFETEEREVTKETRCGVFGCYPPWLQILASKKSYVILFGLVGMNQLAIGSYAVATITTLEKRFKIPSQTSGIITGSWDFGTICSSITIAYIGSKGHKTRWVALGTLLVSVACYSQLLPYILFGPGSDAIAIAQSSNSTDKTSIASSCGMGALYSEDCYDGNTSSTPAILIFMSQFLLGVGVSMYWTLGIAYLDDNVRKNQTPWLIAISSTIRLFGSPIGFWVASKAVEFYVDPTLSPPITDKDPRWIGAWWMGWIPFGIIASIFSVLLSLFPRVLPRASQRLKEQARVEVKTEEKTGNNTFGGFCQMLKRLFRNRLLLCNTFSYVFYMFGVLFYYVYMPKYMESQFHMTASDANMITGNVGLISSAIGVIASGYVVSSFKPSARMITGCNFGVEALGVICMIVYAHLGCQGNNLHGQWAADGSWDLNQQCNSECNCGPSVPYEPVCDLTRSVTFFSPCHAGCSEVVFYEGVKMFKNCSCIPETFTAVDSFCPVDCQYDLIIFLVIFCIMSLLSSMSHSGLVIIQFRTVDPEDKSVSIALSEMMCSALAYIPAPIIYGYLIDKSCMVWGQTCGERGNCWLYFGETLRYYANYTSAGFLTVALVFDFGTWYYSKNLALYDEDCTEDTNHQLQGENNSKRKKQSLIQDEAL
ncbi:solute carrier organic anion transporter family member 74D-like isoform X1 [Homalodisca vitripennis]|uniref:solute carrier organic anion transporter family member 74D-like isoform X1 n=1 Tax=Homalodisca vitripennis TaxID=197043 RepID=UPI001EEC2F30|nr:solute carrier organic anion transporter family member 74D-like isoform X1 [Homalodisca vitripennis]